MNDDAASLQVTRGFIDWFSLVRVCSRSPYLYEEAIRLRLPAEIAIPGLYPEGEEPFHPLNSSYSPEFGPVAVHDDQPIHASRVEVEITLAILEFQLA